MEAAIRTYYEAANRNDIATMDALHSEDFILDLPQSGERIRGRVKITELRTNYPAKVHFETRRIIGSGDLWVWEGTISYNDGPPMNRVAVLEFRSGHLTHETDYFGEPFAAPAWRAKYVEPMPSVP
jgi:ketosteroid isomerase-like protein